ncbi:MAG TPA: hypothetical protein PKD52_00265 [Clostridiales bacterium]|nr:hypothetical protein [Clostridiales bacterium]
MKRFCLFCLSTLLALPLALLVFIILNNLTLLPWSVTRLLWYGFPSVFAFAVGMLYGLFRFKEGGALFFAALLFAGGIYAANRFHMPFGDDLKLVIPLAVAVIFTLLGESCGRFLRQRSIKKRNAQRVPHI